MKDTIEKVNKYLEKAPEGRLKVQRHRAKYCYFQEYVREDDGTYVKKYISQKDVDFAKALAQKGYFLKVKPILEKNLRALELFLQRYDEAAVTSIFDTLTRERKALVEPIGFSVQDQLKSWRNEVYEPYLKYQENMKYETEQGEMVRSKSEVIIANILYQHREKILYKYERPLELFNHGEKEIFHPDFTIINVRTGKITYWEHAGRMDEPRYAEEFVRKMNLYMDNQIIPGKNLIVTYETYHITLNVSTVKKMIEQLL